MRVELWEFHGDRPKWTVEVDGPLLIGGISPSGAWLVVFYDKGNRTGISIPDTKTGRLKTKLLVVPIHVPIHPLDITFDSESRFYSHHDTYRISYDCIRTSNERSSIILPSSGQLPLVERSQRNYDVGDTYEWVVCDSKRICWIPPGYLYRIVST